MKKWWMTAAALLLATGAAQAEVIAVLGTGQVGSAIGPQFAKLGHTVVYGSRNPDSERVRALVERTGNGARAASSAEAAAAADVVMIATPWEALEALLPTLALDGKILIDATTPLRMTRDGLMELSIGTGSGAERVQAWAPKARVVKAFSTIGFHVMADLSKGGGPVTALIASDDAEAKAWVTRLAAGVGFETFDAGPLRHARALEEMVVLYVLPYLNGKREQGFEFHMRQGTMPPPRRRQQAQAG